MTTNNDTADMPRFRAGFLDEFLANHKEWSVRNFGPFRPETTSDPLLGVLEEQGELSRALLKGKQGIRGTPKEHRAAEADALADMAIFLCDGVNRSGVRGFDECILALVEPRKDALGVVVSRTTSILHYAAVITRWLALVSFDNDCAEQHGPYMSDRRRVMFSRIMLSLLKLSHELGHNLPELMESVWAKIVSKRNWVENPDTGSVSE